MTIADVKLIILEQQIKTAVESGLSSLELQGQDIASDRDVEKYVMFVLRSRGFQVSERGMNFSNRCQYKVSW